MNPNVNIGNPAADACIEVSESMFSASGSSSDVTLVHYKCSADPNELPANAPPSGAENTVPDSISGDWTAEVTVAQSTQEANCFIPGQSIKDPNAKNYLRVWGEYQDGEETRYVSELRSFYARETM